MKTTYPGHADILACDYRPLFYFNSDEIVKRETELRNNLFAFMSMGM